MKIKKILFYLMLISTFGFSQNIFATDRSHSSDSGGRDHASSRGEMNRDNDLQNAEESSDLMIRRGGTPIELIDVGTPTDPDYDYYRDKEEMRNHR